VDGDRVAVEVAKGEGEAEGPIDGFRDDLDAGRHETLVQPGRVVVVQPDAHADAERRRVEVDSGHGRAHREGHGRGREDLGVGVRSGKARQAKVLLVEGGGHGEIANLQGDEVGGGDCHSVNILTLDGMCQDIDMSESPAAQIGYLLKETQSLLHTRMDEVLRPLGLTVPQYSCLLTLQQQPGITSSELARRGFVSRQSMNVLLQSLADRGLVTRDDEPGPRNQLAAQLTPATAELLAEAQRGVEAVVTRMTSALPAEGLVELRDSLVAIRNQLS